VRGPRGKPRFSSGQRILVTRSGHCSSPDSLAEVLRVLASARTEVYHVRWQDGREDYLVPGPEAHDRRERDDGPPLGLPERRTR
jgi:Domain of unknown function (DUF1918)